MELSPRFNLLNELINHDLSRPKNEYEQLDYAGHAIETLWRVMYEALGAAIRNSLIEARICFGVTAMWRKTACMVVYFAISKMLTKTIGLSTKRSFPPGSAHRLNLFD